MDEVQPEHESVARIQARLKSGGKPPKKKTREKRNKKSSGGCQIKRRKAKKMFPWMFMPGIESGRSRRRRESSSDSRRKRRDRRRRDRTRSRERSRGRSPRSRRSEASSSLPVAEPGYRWCQIPETVLHGGTGPAVAQAPLPPPPAPPVQQWPPQQRGAPQKTSSSWQQKSWQPSQAYWGQQTRSQRGSGSSGKWNQSWGQHREKGWNKWPKKDEGRGWPKPDPKDKPPEEGPVFSAETAGPGETADPGEDHYKVAEATQEEMQLGRLSVRKRAFTPICGRRPYSRPWLIPIGLCVLGSWSRVAA